ncbi:MAG: DUF4143 domain-containing protein [Rhodothermales bacterium]
MREAFGWDIDRFIFYGGLPGAASVMDNPAKDNPAKDNPAKENPAYRLRSGLSDERDVHARWVRFIRSSVVERAISRDILQNVRLNKPTLIGRLFELCCRHSGDIVPYAHMLRALRDVGNTTTLAYHLRLLSAAGLATGVPKYRGEDIRKRASSPKLQVINSGLVSALSGITFREARADRGVWDRLTRATVGAHLVNSGVGGHNRLYYWLDRGREVDFVVESGGRRSERHRLEDHLRAIELRIGDISGTMRGIFAFGETFPPVERVTVGRSSPRTVGRTSSRRFSSGNQQVSVERFLFERVNTRNRA